MSADEPHVVVTLRTIYDDQQDMMTQVAGMDQKLDNLISTNERLDTHGERLSSLERRMSSIKVIIGIITAGVAAMVVKFFQG